MKNRTSSSPSITATFNLSDDWIHSLVANTDRSNIASLIQRLFVDFYLAHPEQAEQLLRNLTEKVNDPLLQRLASAPFDDEPLTEEDLAAIDEGLADIDAGRMIPNDSLDLWTEE